MHSTVALTVDWGTESYLTVLPDCSLYEYFPWLTLDRSDALNLDVGDETEGADVYVGPMVIETEDGEALLGTNANADVVLPFVFGSDDVESEPTPADVPTVATQPPLGSSARQGRDGSATPPPPELDAIWKESCPAMFDSAEALRISMAMCLHATGMMHIIHHSVEEMSKAMTWWPTFFSFLAGITDLLRRTY
jgi:hypothetical protein